MIRTFADGKLSYNFSAGPCVLPRAVLDQCAEAMVEYNQSGQSILELSHRGKEFAEIAEACRSEIRQFL
jgi:phosphoserine aminotransferase